METEMETKWKQVKLQTFAAVQSDCRSRYSKILTSGGVYS